MGEMPGTDMTVWGGYGYDSTGTLVCFNTRGRYNLLTDSWVSTSLVDSPVARESHTAVWTGVEMIVWGGDDCHGNLPYDLFGDLGRYLP